MNRTYIVSFNRATKTNWGGYQITFNIGRIGEEVKHEVEAANFSDLGREVQRLAAGYGLPCSPYVRLKDRNARKPDGFERWCKTVNIIDQEAA